MNIMVNVGEYHEMNVSEGVGEAVSYGDNAGRADCSFRSGGSFFIFFQLNMFLEMTRNFLRIIVPIDDS